MSIATHALKYGWAYLATLTLGTGTIFMVNPVLNRITLHDRIEIAIGTDERCIGIQTANGTYPVPRPSIIRTWTDTNGASVVMTNALEWRDDLSMKQELDTKLFALAPHYKDPITFQALTVTGIFASLGIGDGVSNFTAIPAIGTNAATFGPWAWRNYRVAWQERYKFLNALQYASNAYMWNSNSTIYVWKAIPVVTGLTPRWRGVRDKSEMYSLGRTWEELKIVMEGNFGDPDNYWHNTNSSDGPISTTYGNPDVLDGVEYMHGAAYAGDGVYEIGPFLTNQIHGVLVRARSVAYGDGFNSQGAISAENEWVDIINVTNSLSVWEYSGSYGGVAFPAWCGYPGSTGNVNQVTYETWYGPNPSHWTRNGDEATNTAFGTNYVFYYCTNAYWE